MRRMFGGTVGIVLAMAWLASSGARAQGSGAKLIERGEYLVERASMCVDCHTPHDKNGKPDPTRRLQGAPFPGAANDPHLAPFAPPIAGLPGRKEEDVIKFLQTGQRPDGSQPRPPMPPYRLNREDAEAVVAYLKSLKPAGK